MSSPPSVGRRMDGALLIFSRRRRRPQVGDLRNGSGSQREMKSDWVSGAGGRPVRRHRSPAFDLPIQFLADLEK